MSDEAQSPELCDYEVDSLSHALLGAITESIFIIRPDGTLIACNEVAASRIGTTVEQLTGRCVYDFFDAEAAEERRQKVSEVLETGKPVRFQSTRDKFVFDATIQPVRGEDGAICCLVVYAHDQSPVVESDTRFRQLVEQSADGVMVVDGKGIVLFMNSAAERLFERSAIDWIGKPFEYPTVVGNKLEVETTGPDGEQNVAQMHVVETSWEGQPAFLATLQDVSGFVRSRQKLLKQAVTDELTGLFNRRGLLKLGAQRLAHADRTERGLLVLYADVDAMKWINDNLGHHMGDKALVEFSRILEKTLRKSDLVARIGGDEFGAIILDTEHGDEATIEARFLANLDAWNNASNEEYTLSCCVGIARYDPKAPCTVENLLQTADDQMYARKKKRGPSLFRARPDA